MNNPQGRNARVVRRCFVYFVYFRALLWQNTSNSLPLLPVSSLFVSVPSYLSSFPPPPPCLFIVPIYDRLYIFFIFPSYLIIVSIYDPLHMFFLFPSPYLIIVPTYVSLCHSPFSLLFPIYSLFLSVHLHFFPFSFLPLILFLSLMILCDFQFPLLLFSRFFPFLLIHSSFSLAAKKMKHKTSCNMQFSDNNYSLLGYIYFTCNCIFSCSYIGTFFVSICNI